MDPGDSTDPPLVDDESVHDPMFDESRVEDDPDPAPDGHAGYDGPSLTEIFLGLVDATTERVLSRPVRPRVKVTPGGLLRGEVDVVKVDIPAVWAAGLVLDRLVVRAERVRVVPGLPPRLRAGPVGFRAYVCQENVHRWTRASHLPVEMLLTPQGVVTGASVGGFRMGEVLTDLTVAGPFLQLRPRRATMLGVPAPMIRYLRGYLPLPPLPRGARLKDVQFGDGELAVTFEIAELDEKLSPDIAGRLRRLLRVPLPGWG